jgi:hypothetical protein
MVGKTGNTTFIKEINDELKKVNPSFESGCIEIAALQRLAKVKTGPVQQPKQKEVSLSNQGTSGGGGGGSKSKCSHCGDTHKRKDCKKLKVGGPAQNMPIFQMTLYGPKSGQTCRMYSPDGVAKVSSKKIDPFMVY